MNIHHCDFKPAGLKLIGGFFVYDGGNGEVRKRKTGFHNPN